jgi:hypothetical protein
MKFSSRIALVSLVAVSATVAIAQTSKDNKPTKPTPPTPPAHANNPQDKGMGEMPPPPPGWTAEEWASCMQACMEAGTPGPNHEFLADAVGVWQGKTTMWMGPGAPPMNSECTTTITSIMDGRFTKADITGDMMGTPFKGTGTYGFDNVTQTFQSTWLDNCSTAIMFGTGELSSDKKTMTWNYKYTCPYTKKPMTMRQVEHQVSDNECKIEMYGTDPKSNKEYKMMEIVSTRKPGVTATGRER